MNNKKIKKITEYLNENKDFLITDENFEFKDISKKDIEILLENIKNWYFQVFYLMFCFLKYSKLIILYV